MQTYRNDRNDGALPPGSIGSVGDL